MELDLLLSESKGKGYLLSTKKGESKVIRPENGGYFQTPLEAWTRARELGYITPDLDGWD